MLPVLSKGKENAPAAFVFRVCLTAYEVTLNHIDVYITYTLLWLNLNFDDYALNKLDIFSSGQKYEAQCGTHSFGIRSLDPFPDGRLHRQGGIKKKRFDLPV